MNKTTTLQKIILGLFGIFLCLILIETGLRLAGHTYLFLQEARNKISLKQENSLRILCLGESTTAWGEEYAYPRQLEKILNSKNLDVKFSVIIKAIPGSGTQMILLNLEKDLKEYNPDIVITMMGINDGNEFIDFDNLPETRDSFYSNLKVIKLGAYIKAFFVNILNNRYGEKDISFPELSKPKKIPFSQKGQMSYSKYLKLGWWYEENWQYKKAVDMFSKAHEIKPLSAEPYVGLAWCSQGKGKVANEHAYKLFNKAIELEPENISILFEFGHWLKDFGKLNEAEKIFKHINFLNPSAITAYVELGSIYITEGKHDKATDILKKAIALFPNNDRLYGELATSYLNQGEIELAEEIYSITTNLRIKHIKQATKNNYQKLNNILAQKGIKHIAVQYPVLNLNILRNTLADSDDVMFVDNEKIFKKAIFKDGYTDYFIDSFGGEFGHCTPKGNELLANNIANVILREILQIK